MNIEQIKDIQLNFILASPRTGSTLLSSMLNAHPNVVSTSEETFTYSLYPKYKNVTKWTSKIIQNFCYDFYLFSEGKFEIQFGTKKDLVDLLENFKEHLTYDIVIKLVHLCFFPGKDKSNITTLVDKHLVFHFILEKVASIYPESKFIILYRDPRDNALVKRRMFERQKTKVQSYYQLSCSWKFVYERLGKLRYKIGLDRFIEVKYEDLVSNPEVELKKICAFLNTPYNEKMLTYDEQLKTEVTKNIENLSTDTKNLITLLHGGLSEKVNTNKVGFWKQGLSKEEADLIWTICGNLAEKIGYLKHDNFVKQPIKFKDYLTYINILITRAKTLLYYSSPFFIKYIIKKIKYGKRFKSEGYSSEEFYQRTYYKN